MPNITIFKQENFPQELGSGEGYTIARYGCALCCITSLANWYNRQITPDQLNLLLVQKGGFASNGTKNADGTDNLTLLKWGSLSDVYGEIVLQHNIAYPSTPADMGMIDAYLAHGQPVVVGVSFLHKSTDTVPSHYVLIYKKNPDGTYQMMDPWYGDDANFTSRYAVNGMSAANAILQVVAYAGPVLAEVPAPSPAPEASHPQQAVTPTDVANSQAEANYNLYLKEVDTNKQLNDRITELQGQVTELQNANSKLTTEIGDTKTLNGTLASQLAKVEQSDSAALEEAQKQIEALKEKEHIVNATAQALQTKPTLHNILSSLDSLFSVNEWAKKITSVKDNASMPSAKSVMSLFGFKEVKHNG